MSSVPFKKKQTIPAAAGNDAEELTAASEISVRGIGVYPDVAEPNDDGQYQIGLIVDPEHPSAELLKRLVRLNLEALYPNGIPRGGYWNPIRSGDEVKGDGTLAFKDEAFRGKLFIRAKTKFAPRVVKGPHRDPAEATLVRSGDHIMVAIAAYSYRNASTGVGLSLNSIWWVKPGERAIGGAGKGGASFGNVDVSGIDFADE